MQFSLFRSEMPVDAVRKLPAHIQKSVLACCLVIGNARLHHVACTVQLMAFLHIGELLTGFLENEIGVEIAVLLLRPRDDGNDFIGALFELFVRTDGQRVCDTLQPLCDITVLKDHSIEGALLKPCCDAEICDGRALFDAGNTVIHDVFLIRNDDFRDERLSR